MSLAIVYSRATQGIQAPLVTVEVHLSPGLQAINIVGLPEAEVKESRDRVRSAIMNAGLTFPNRRITVNLAPADLPKEGGRYDLPIALGILAASYQIPADILLEYEFAGELALNGELRAVRGVLPMALETHRAGRKLCIPRDNVAEATLIEAAEVYAGVNLLAVCAHLTAKDCLMPEKAKPFGEQDIYTEESLDLIDVLGQPHARRALEIAAAGEHSMLMVGPPGTGKTMMASRLPSILPELTQDEALEVAAIRSITQRGIDSRLWRKRPFRSPHHTASAVALVGGGRAPKPGEISLAHRGVLFLDELPEFDRKVLEVLREPLESGRVTISRAHSQAEFPAHFQFISAMNPCPCGYLTDTRKACQCTVEQVNRYRARLSGPLMDRIDMHIEVPALPVTAMMAEKAEMPESSQVVRGRVLAARERQYQRHGKVNSKLSNTEIKKACALDSPSKQFLDMALEKLGLSARAYHRVLKVARTIADLQASVNIQQSHISEALSYRRLDRALN